MSQKIFAKMYLINLTEKQQKTKQKTGRLVGQIQDATSKCNPTENYYLWFKKKEKDRLVDTCIQT